MVLIPSLSCFTNTLRKDGDGIFRKAESNNARLLIPTIVIGETIYTILKDKNIFGNVIAKDKINNILNVLHQSPAFKIVNLSKNGWRYFLGSRIKGLHDRMIVSICKQEGVENLITKDKEIKSRNEINVLW